MLGDDEVVLSPGVYWGERTFLADSMSLAILGDVVHDAARGTTDDGDDVNRSQFLADLVSAEILSVGDAALAGDQVLVPASTPACFVAGDEIDHWFVPFLGSTSLDAIASSSDHAWERPLLVQGLDGAARFVGPYATSPQDLYAMQLALGTSVDHPRTAEAIAGPMDRRGAVCVQWAADLGPIAVADPAAYDGRMIFWAPGYAVAWTVLAVQGLQ